MAFDFRSFARFATLALFRRKGEHCHLTPRRVALFSIVCFLYALYEAAIWSGYLLDEALFGGYRRQEIREPVFIVGNPRSGTTFLYRVLARDARNFTCTRAWETLLAPSISSRKVFQALAGLDRRAGSPIQRQIAAWESRLHKEISMHKFGLRFPEEDENFLVHVFSAMELWLFAALIEDAVPLTYFDSMLPERDRERIMGYYARCIQRHLYAHRAYLHPEQRYLAKNPYASARIGALYKHFPDARFIYLARNPLDMIPSWVSSVAYGWRVSGGTPDLYASRDFVLDMAEHWYRYPLACFERAPRGSHIVVKFDDLISNIEGTVRDIYDQFGLEASVSIKRAVCEAAERSNRYESSHEYSLEQVGLTREQIVDRLKDVFERFGFDTRESASPAEA